MNAEKGTGWFKRVVRAIGNNCPHFWREGAWSGDARCHRCARRDRPIPPASSERGDV